MSAGTAAWLAVRSLFWTAAFPGFFAGYVPWRFFGLSEVRLDLLRPLHVVAVLDLTAGVVLLEACIWEFDRSGRGTLAPLDPPRELVVRGLYRYVRNPMYLGVSLIVLGEALLTGSRGLMVYWIIWFLVVNLFVRFYEEPTLRRQFGQSYERYAHAVGRWVPRLPPSARDG
jgi:protein-S-isoprenylcysteine O-methyltransferase Ste14